MKKPPTYEVRVIGCKVNQYEAEQARQLLASLGFVRVQDNEIPDIGIVHTCAVTATAGRKSRQAARQLLASGACRVFVTGCAVSAPDFAPLEGITGHIPSGPDWLKPIQAAALDVSGMKEPLQKAPDGDAFPLKCFSKRARAFLKIQDGCTLGCTYCIVPRLRGPSREKPLPQIVAEARALVNAGYREIVVSGVSVGLYGQKSGYSLADVLRTLSTETGVERLRLSSLHPSDLTDKLLEVWSTYPSILPHMHLPLQSGSTRVLKAMNRSYTRDDFIKAVALARKILSTPAITTDLIAGFPSETDKDFEATFNLCEKLGFSRMHVFPYSARPGTAAADFTQHISRHVVSDRTAKLRRLASCLASQYRESRNNTIAHVLVEQFHEASGECAGHDERYLSISFPGHADWEGTVVPVQLHFAGGMAHHKVVV